MSAYIVIPSTIKNQEKMQEYLAMEKYLEQFNGKLIVAGPSQALSGKHDYTNMVVLEFSDANNAKSWFNSTEYQNKKKILDEATDNSFILIEN